MGPRVTCRLQPARARTKSTHPTLPRVREGRVGVFWIIHRYTPTDVCRVDLGPTAGLLARGSAPRPAFPAAKQPLVAHVGRDFPLTVAGAAADLGADVPHRIPFSPSDEGPSMRLTIDFDEAYCQSSLAACATRSQSMIERPKLTLVLGGARSGKSRYAEGLIAALPPPWVYVATAEAVRSMRWLPVSRAHRARRGPSWRHHRSAA